MATGTKVVAVRFPSELAVSLDCVSVRGQIVSDVAVEWDLGWIRLVSALITARILQFAYHTSKLIPVVVLVQIPVTFLNASRAVHLCLNGAGRVVSLFEPGLVREPHPTFPKSKKFN